MTATDEQLPAATAQQPSESEDWLAIGVAILSIALVLGGLRPALPAFAWGTAAELGDRVLSGFNLTKMLIIGAALGLLSLPAIVPVRSSIRRFAIGFPALYALALLSQAIAGNVSVSAWGLEYVIFAFGLGLIVSNFVGVPAWLSEVTHTEYFIKTGLVLLGAGIVFGDLMRAGLLGIGQAIFVVVAVWFVCFTLARRFNVDEDLATMMASAVSICGISAAIATCGVIHGDRKKLSYVTSLVLIVAAPMIVAMPLVVKAFGIPDAVGGAWLGGTLDTSASVVAATETISSTARNAGVVVKLSQNVLIGVAAFLLTFWWALRNKSQQGERPSFAIIWERFPKFVLGFIAVSLVFSFLLDGALVKQTGGILTGMRTMWFALAFTSIGLETRFADLVKAEKGRAACAFICGQAFNVVWTLLLAYLFFGGYLFAVPTFE